MWEIIFFGLEKGQVLENRAAHPHQEFPGVPPPPWVLALFAGVEIYERLYAITESLRSINSV